MVLVETIELVRSITSPNGEEGDDMSIGDAVIDEEEPASSPLIRRIVLW